MPSLMLHAGAHIATLEDVTAAPTPEADEATGWTPVAHRQLIDLTVGELESAGLTISASEHGLWKDGQRYFGVFQVQNGVRYDAYSLVIGLRNSHDRSFAASLALGSRVFVCDNLAFSGEVKLARKHTVHILRDLPRLVMRAVGQLGDLRGKQEDRFLAYQRCELVDKDAHDLMIKAVVARAVPGQTLPKVVQEWRRPTHEDFQPRNAWSLFNCFTEVMKQGSAWELSNRTQALYGLFDTAAGVN